jgi:hypothetical protein
VLLSLNNADYLFKIILEIGLARKVGVEVHCSSLAGVHPEIVLLDVILRSTATKNLIVNGSPEILHFVQNDMK